MREKGFAPLLIIISVAALAILIGGYLIYSGKINLDKLLLPPPPIYTTKYETANWKTYTNKDYSFFFKYPAQFTLKEDIKIQQDSKTIYTLLFYTEDQKYSGYSVQIHKAPKKTILQEFPQEFRQQALSIPIKALSNTQGADEAARAENTQDGYKSEIRYFRVGDNFFVIGPIYQDSNSDDKIWNYPVLETVVFNKESTTPTSEEIRGFSIYPGSKFVEKVVTEPCNEKNNFGGMMCGSTVYTWTSDEADKVYDYYHNDPEGSGWKISGGAGSYNDAQNYGTNSSIKKDNLMYFLNMNAENNKVRYSLGIPTNK